jgi:hypothetical protein
MATNLTGTIQFYNSFLEYLGDGTIDLDTHTFKLKLVTSSYTFSAAHTVVADLTNEVSGGGYAEATLDSVTWTRSSGVVTFDCADEVFTASGGNFTARRWVLYDDTPTSPADPLIASGLLNNADADVTVTDGNTLTWAPNASGIFTLQEA